MSDYEGNWEPLSSTVSSFAPVVPPNPNHNYIVPKGTSLLEAQQAAQRKSRRPNQPTAHLPENYRPGLQSLLPVRATIVNGKIQPRQDAQAPIHIQKQVLELESYRQYRANPMNPDATYDMFIQWSGLIRRLHVSSKLKAEEYATDLLAEISVSVKAFISVPSPNEAVIKIWGTEEQIAKAKDRLQNWERSIIASQKPSNGVWIKESAVDGREEDRVMREALLRENFVSFQHFSQDIIFPYEAILVWPEGHDLAAFIDDYDTNTLNFLRQEYGCAIDHVQEGPTKLTKIGSDNMAHVKHVYLRLMRLVKEMVARRKRGVHAVHCRLPSFAVARESVATAISAANKDFHVPYLVGEPLPAAEAQKWQHLVDTSHKQYRLAVKQAVKTALQSLHVSQKHVSMKVNFGEMALCSYRRADNGACYDLEEFLAKASEANVTTALLPLLNGTDYSLIDALDAKLGQPSISWVVEFHFSGNASKLVLQKEYINNIVDPQEPSMLATRWLDYPELGSVDTTERLELDCFDFEKTGYQFVIESVPLYGNEKVKRSLESFENHINFKPSLGGLKYASTRHAIYPPGNAELKKVEETTIGQYKFKTGILEVRRIDSFGVGEVVTTWQASYYYQAWTNLMAEFANIQPGENVSWDRDLSTFFPKAENSTTRASSGFKDFMKEVEEIQELLGEALPKGENGGHQLNGDRQSQRVHRKETYQQAPKNKGMAQSGVWQRQGLQA